MQGTNELERLSKLLKFLKDEEGQDLIEYSLLIALLVISSAVLFSRTGSSVNTVWVSAKGVLSNAAVVAGS